MVFCVSFSIGSPFAFGDEEGHWYSGPTVAASLPSQSISKTLKCHSGTTGYCRVLGSHVQRSLVYHHIPQLLDEGTRGCLNCAGTCRRPPQVPFLKILQILFPSSNRSLAPLNSRLDSSLTCRYRRVRSATACQFCWSPAR